MAARICGNNVACFQFGTFFLISLASTFCHPAWAIDKTDDIDTNRPSFMFSPLTVPKGSIQVENGVLYKYLGHGTNYFDASETQFRFGVLKNTEFEIFAPNYVATHTEHTVITRSGVSDLSEVGIKHNLAFKKLNVGLIGGLNIPTGSTTISGPGVQPIFRVPWSYPIKSWSIQGMQSLVLLNSSRDPQYSPDFMLNKSFGKRARTNVFVEYVGFFTHEEPPQQIAHFGLNKYAPSSFVGAGYSFRVDGFPWIKHN